MSQDTIAKIENGRVKRVRTNGTTVSAFNAPKNATHVIDNGNDTLSVYRSDGKVSLYKNNGSIIRTV